MKPEYILRTFPAKRNHKTGNWLWQAVLVKNPSPDSSESVFRSAAEGYVLEAEAVRDIAEQMADASECNEHIFFTEKWPFAELPQELQGFIQEVVDRRSRAANNWRATCNLPPLVPHVD